MTTLFSWDSGSVPGTVDGTTPTVDGTDLVFPATVTTSAVYFTTSALAQATVRYYITMPSAWPSASWSTFLAWIPSAFMARLNISGSSAPGQFRVVKTGGTQAGASPSSTLVVSTEYRFEMQIDGTNQTMRGAVFPMGSDTALFDTGLITSAASATALTRWYFGKGATGAVAPSDLGETRISHIKAVDTVGSWIGRDASDPLPTTGPELMGIWNGTGFDAAELMGAWNGTGYDAVETFQIA